MAGNLPFEAAVRIANMKLEGMLSYELKIVSTTAFPKPTRSIGT